MNHRLAPCPFRFFLLLCLGFVVIVLAGFLGCESDDETDEDSVGENDDGDAQMPVWEPLADDLVPFLISGSLPVPTHRFADATHVLSLNGLWSFHSDPDDVGEVEGWQFPEYDRSTWTPQEVPGSWNAQVPELVDYEGVGWYATQFDIPAQASTAQRRRMMLRFGAIFLRSKVYLNGALIGEHNGGYTPLHLAVHDRLLATRNLLVVRVDNRITWKTIPVDTVFHPQSHGWWPYGGITRSVSLHILPDPWLFKVEPSFTTKAGNLVITLGLWAFAKKDRLSVQVELTDPSAGRSASSIALRVPDAGYFAYQFPLETGIPATWSRNRPENLYTLTLRESAGGDTVSVRFGYRTFEVDEHRLVLNGRTDFWRGINRHSCHPDTGPIETETSIAREITLLHELGANHVRPGHYPVDPRLLDALLDAGITVLEEVPVYQLQFGQMKNDALIADAAHQLAEMIERDKNNPAILAWSVGNEYGNFWPSSRILTQELNRQAKRFDPKRPTAAIIASVSCVVPIDFTLPYVDIIGVNQYYGWYQGRVDQAGQCLDTIHRLYPNKPILATEFGAGAVAGWYLNEGVLPGPEPLHDHSYTEDFQGWLLEQHLEQFLERPYISGFMPWILADFRMEWNPSTGDPHPVLGMNLKGLVSRDRTTRKMAFEAVTSLYANAPGSGQ